MPSILQHGPSSFAVRHCPCALLLEAVAAGEAHQQEDDDGEQDDGEGDHQLHLAVLPPHAAADGAARAHKAVGLNTRKQAHANVRAPCARLLDSCRAMTHGSKCDG